MKEANAMYEEARKEKEVERGDAQSELAGSTARVDGTDFNTLREMEKMCVGIGGDECDYGRLETLLETSEQCRVFHSVGRGLPDCSSCVGCWDSRAGDLRGRRGEAVGSRSGCSGRRA